MMPDHNSLRQNETLQYDNRTKRITMATDYEIKFTGGKHVKREFMITMGCIALGLAVIQIAQSVQNQKVIRNCPMLTHRIVTTGAPIEQKLCIKRDEHRLKHYV